MRTLHTQLLAQGFFKPASSDAFILLGLPVIETGVNQGLAVVGVIVFHQRASVSWAASRYASRELPGDFCNRASMSAAQPTTLVWPPVHCVVIGAGPDRLRDEEMLRNRSAELVERLGTCGCDTSASAACNQYPANHCVFQRLNERTF